MKTDLVDVARGQRLRRVRAMTGLDRRAFANKHGFGESTLNQWENALSRGLRASGAERIVSALRGEGILCTISWLLHGEGEEPHAIDVTPPTHLTKKTQLTQELQLFQSHSAHHVVAQCVDDTLEPFYQSGDYLGAVLSDVTDRDAWNNRVAILKMPQGELACKKIMSDDHLDRAGLIERVWRIVSNEADTNPS